MAEGTDPLARAREELARAFRNEWHDTRFYGRGGAEYSMHRVARFAVDALAAAGLLRDQPAPMDEAVHSLMPEMTWQQLGVRHPDDGSVYDSFDGTREAAERLARRVEGSVIVVRDHSVGPWRPVEEEGNTDDT